MLCQLIREGGVVIDAGATVGRHTMFFAVEVGDEGAYSHLSHSGWCCRHCGQRVLNGLVNVTCMQRQVLRGGAQTLARCRPRSKAPRALRCRACRVPEHNGAPKSADPIREPLCQLTRTPVNCAGSTDSTTRSTSATSFAAAASSAGQAGSAARYRPTSTRTTRASCCRPCP